MSIGRAGFLRMLLGGAALALATAAQAEDAVLLSSTEKEYTVGTVIADGQVLALSAGADAVLLFRSGTILKIKGPFEGSLETAHPSSAAAGDVAALVAALKTRGVDAFVIGATRRLSDPRAAVTLGSEPVTVDTKRSAIYCIGASNPIWLVGPPETKALVRLRHGKSVREIAWPAGATRVPWPDDVMIENGDQFEVLDQTGTSLATMIFHRLEPARSGPEWVAEGVLSGCRDQVEPSLRELELGLGSTASE